jgi:hypothetical protein
LAIASILVMVVFAFLYGLNGLAFLGFHLFDRFALPGLWASCLQGMGILGGYIGKINLEVKKRPRLFHRRRFLMIEGLKQKKKTLEIILL